MILRAILDKYEKRKETSRGNPTGSRFGSCLAQIQLLQYPELSRPEPWPARSLMVMEMGNRVEQWFSDIIEEAYPAYSGLTQEPFYIRIPLPSERAVEDLRHKIEARTIWGKVLQSFTPPTIRMGEDGRVKIRLLPCPKCDADGGNRNHSWPCGKKLGIVLVPARSEAWVPTFLDRVIMHDDLGLVAIEKKAVSNWQFRRALFGEIDYQKRCQLAGISEATSLDVVLLLYRKETAHLLEIAYLRKAGHISVRLLKSNHVEEVYRVNDVRSRLVDQDGKESLFPADTTWEGGIVETPYEPRLMDEVRSRVLAALLYQPGQEPFREYGPQFTCPVCQGTGTQTLGKGTHKPLKTPKPCEDCRGGLLDATALPNFPCGYCQVRTHCWDKASPILELTDKPKWMITRAAFEASGLTFQGPEAIQEPDDAPA